MKIKLFYTAGKETTKRAKLHPRHNDVAGGDGDGNHGDCPGNGWNKCVFLLFTVHHAGIGVGVGVDVGVVGDGIGGVMVIMVVVVMPRLSKKQRMGQKCISAVSASRNLVSGINCPSHNECPMHFMLHKNNKHNSNAADRVFFFCKQT